MALKALGATVFKGKIEESTIARVIFKHIAWYAALAISFRWAVIAADLVWHVALVYTLIVGVVCCARAFFLQCVPITTASALIWLRG